LIVERTLSVLACPAIVAGLALDVPVKGISGVLEDFYLGSKFAFDVILAVDLLAPKTGKYAIRRASV
jgi:hypothetical protein